MSRYLGGTGAWLLFAYMGVCFARSAASIGMNQSRTSSTQRTPGGRKRFTFSMASVGPPPGMACERTIAQYAERAPNERMAGSTQRA